MQLNHELTACIGLALLLLLLLLQNGIDGHRFEILEKGPLVSYGIHLFTAAHCNAFSERVPECGTMKIGNP